ncbi:MAG TPA: hypothetical protein VF249_06950, partial [Arthrobacter sp.]
MPAGVRRAGAVEIPTYQEVVSELPNSPQLPVSYSEPEFAREYSSGNNARASPEINSALISVFRELDKSGMPWVLLRGVEDLVRPAGDVDLLVSAELVPGLDRLVAGVGFRRVVALGHGSHRFYFRYLSEEDLWIKLDVVSDISFGQF